MPFFPLISRAVIHFSVFLPFIFAFMPGAAHAASACTHYASPTGTGNGSSTSQPFKIANFWPLATPGSTLCLLDGQYTGSASMINPPQNLNGTPTQKITIRALNDGGALFTGSGAGSSRLLLENNDHFIIEGINVCCTAGDVIRLGSGADNNTIRRVAAWNASDDTNNMVWSIHANTGNLLEDVAGFGTGRKMFQWFGSSTSATLTIRRAWARWERHIYKNASGVVEGVFGPKMAFTLTYNSFGALYENVIGTWDASFMPPGYPVDQPHGILATDGIQPASTLTAAQSCAGSRVLGSIAYLPTGVTAGTATLGGTQASQYVNCLTYEHVVSHTVGYSIEPVKLVNLAANHGGPSSGQHIYRNGTEIGATTGIVGSDWTATNRATGATVAAVPNIWNGSGSTGARVCKRYENGTLTSTGLWPWPMNQRIIDAMNLAGKTSVDVTKTMEQIFGPIPSECRSGSVGPVPLGSPTNLSVHQ